MDFDELSDGDLRLLKTSVETELRRRETLATAESKVGQINYDYLTATGTTAGQAWRAPTGAHDAYPKGWVVTHGDKLWRSLTAGNVWEPGVSGWREVIEEGGEAPEWVQPTGAHDAYDLGDRVTFEGATYVSIIENNTWSPTDYPDGWDLVTPAPEEPGEPEPEVEPEEPAPEPEPVEEPAPVWVQPTGAHDAYNIGDRVTFADAVYESSIDGNIWSPTDYPAGWYLIA